MARSIGRYVLHDEIAAGGMASVHVAKLAGAAGFSRAVAVKRLHAHFAKDPDFVAMFVDEARLASRIRHPNVVPVLDVVSTDGELFLVMEYVHGEPLSKLARRARDTGESTPAAIAVRIMIDVLEALEAAHTTKGPDGESLHLVHRDVSPQNVLVGDDGAARLLDFGIAKAVGRQQTTREGEVKGKSSYMSPEQVRGLEVDRRSDVFAATIVLWELLTSKRLFASDHPMATMALVLEMPIPAPSTVVASLPPTLDEVVLKGLARDLADRFPSARAMADALGQAFPPASEGDVAKWVAKTGGDGLKARAELISRIESSPNPDVATAYPDRTTDDDTQKDPASTVDASAVRRTLPLPDAPPRIPVVTPARRSFPWAIVSIAALVTIGAGAFAATRGRTTPPVTVATAAKAAELPVVTTAASVAPPESAAPEPIESAKPKATVSKPRPAPAPPRPKADLCNPPWTVDGQGVRILKRECL